jgi:hypothetical protein
VLAADACPASDRRSMGRSVIAGRARQRTTNVAPTIADLQAAGVTSQSAIAAALNERGIPTARGDKWQAVQFARVLERMRVEPKLRLKRLSRESRRGAKCAAG